MIFNMITGGSAAALTGFVSNVKTFTYDTSVKIWWTDPDDDQWAGTRLVRKEGGFPTGPTDGKIVTDSKVSNQYSYSTDDSPCYEDTGLTKGTTYFYCLFPYSKSNQFTSDVSGQFSILAKQTIFFITFMSEGEEKYKCKVNEGDTPSYAGTAITHNKAGDRDFDEWSPKLYAANKDQTYTATFKVFLTYKHYDGSGNNLHKEQVKHGGNGTWSGTDSRSSTAQYSYTFAGWSLTKNGSASSSARNNLQADTTVYSAFTQATRKYTITWKNFDGTTLKTESVAYGTTPSYSGTPSFNGWKFTGWNPTPKAVTGAATYYATYTLPSGMTETITKNWDEVIADAKAGTTSGYSTGATKVMVLTDGTPLCMELAGIKTTSGATFDWISRTTAGDTKWNNSNSNTNGYPSSVYKTYLEGTVLNKFPTNIKNALKSVTKYCYCYSPKNANLSYTAKIWPPNYREMNYGTERETSGPCYSYYSSNTRRIRYNTSGTAVIAWLSSTSNTGSIYAVYIITDGYWHHTSCSNSIGALPCFCL